MARAMRTSSAFKIFGLTLLFVTAFGFLDTAHAAPELPTFSDVIGNGIEIPEGKPGMKPRDPRPTIFQSTRRSLSDSLDYIDVDDDIYQYKLVDSKHAGFYEVKGRDFGAPIPLELTIIPVDNAFHNEFVDKFLAAISREKLHILDAYKLSNTEYNRLAILAFGILGMESKFGESAKYIMKETCQPCVAGAKIGARLVRNLLKGRFTARITYTNSRGPTQIKTVPKKIQRLYPEITLDTLNNPEHAGIVTVGFLAERLNEMKVRVAYNRGKERNFDYINQSNVYDYIMYAYFGSMDQLFKSTATPGVNPYISGNNSDPEKPRRGLRDHIRYLTILER